MSNNYGYYSVFQSAEVQKLWVLGKRQEAKVKREEKYVYLTSLGNALKEIPVLRFNQEDNSDRTAINVHGAFPKSDRFVAGLALGNAPYGDSGPCIGTAIPGI
ncbi:MAG: hypothetical protein LW728_13340 [Microcystis sp. 49638_E5]|uniref:hypothetical protein n=1 Tax=Microcystis sp. 49638_E5 TaxID=2904986 RepID=UPI00258E7429|nr:hypothetical protein [Microcystis sp. 49638_E5]MCE2670169.1 hypothetical protein [Microcystis sp. 49638_E5]